MPNVAQMTVDAAYAELDKLSAAGKREQAALEAQRVRLQNAYSAARAAGNTQALTALQPLIHRNSQLRLDYRAFVAKFNSVVNGIGGLLKSAGLKVPTLAGVGILPTIIVPAVWALGIVAAWAIVNRLTEGRVQLEHDAQSLLAIANDPNRTPEERAAALAALGKTRDAAAHDDPLGVGKLIPLGIIAAVLLLGPSLVRAIPKRNPRRRRRRAYA